MNARYLILTAACCLAFASLSAQQGLIAPMGRWTAYVSHYTTKQITGMNGLLYLATNGGVYSYDPSTEQTRTYTKVEGLSGTDPTAIHADANSGLLFIGYSDGMVNILDPNGRISYVSDIERTDLFTTKGIVTFHVHEGLLYIASRFGIVAYDIDRRETRFSMTKIGTNPTGSEVTGMAVADGMIWATLGTRGVWAAAFSDPAYPQPDAWQKVSGTDNLPNTSATTLSANGQTLFALLGDSIYRRPPGGPWARAPFPTQDYNSLSSSGGYTYATFKPSFMAILQPADTVQIVDRNGSVTCGYVEGDMILVGDATVGWSRNGPNNTFYGSAPRGPRNNYVTDIAAGNGELYIAPRGKSGASGRFFDRSGIPYFALHNGYWRINDHRNGALRQDDVWRDFARATFHAPTGQCYVGSWGEGIVQLDSGKVVRTLQSDNSGLTLSIYNDHRVSGMAFDEQGNLWITQFLNTHCLNVLTADSQWYAFNPYPGTNPVGIETDSYGNKWIIDQDEGLVIFNDNFTPGDPSDDQSRLLTASYGQGGLPNNSVRALALDHDQQMWIGTTDGVTILYDPSLMFTTDFQDAACPIIDGYCLLRGQEVFDIEVDGANRKWIATNNGVYFVNIDGTQLLGHFTEANSPLLSNEVTTLEIDQSTGEVFFGTTKGIVSYMGESIAGREDASQLYVFPNPIPFEFDMPIMIKGMRKFSRVKIATVAGEVVRELESLGGEVPWDGRDAWGRKVNPGIYLVMVSDPDGGGAGITKLVILERPE